jgi:hypothetical protein
MNWYRKLSVLLVAITALTLGVGVASAQGPDDERTMVGARALIAALQELADVPLQEIVESVEPGMTLAEVAAANDLEAAAIVAQAADSLTAHVNEQVENGRLEQEEADAILATLTDDLTALMNAPLPEQMLRPNRQERPIIEHAQEVAEQGLIGALAEATGLTPQEMIQQAREQEFTTLAEIAEANGVNPDDVIAAATEALTTRIEEAAANGDISEEQAAELLGAAEEFFTTAMTDPIMGRFISPPQQQRMDVVGELNRALVQEISAVTGLDPQAIVQEVQAGSSLAAIMEANGVDADAVVNTVVDQFSTQIEEVARQLINRTPQPRPERERGSNSSAPNFNPPPQQPSTNAS